MEKFDLAILGLGGMGHTHMEAAKASPYVDKIYGYEPDWEYTQKRSQEFNIEPATLEAILGNPSIRMVSIAASNKAHVPLSIQALKAGKAVLCEKPLGTTLEEAERLIQVEQETGGFLQIGFELHYSTMYQQVKEWITQGKIGEVVNIQSRYLCSEFHRKGNWRSNSTGSFLIGEKLSHYLDLQRWFLAPQKPRSVFSLSAPKVVPYFNHRDNHQIMTRYDGGSIATLNFIMYSGETYKADPLQEMLEQQSDDGHALQYIICGTKGIIETDVFKRRIRRFAFTEAEDGLDNKIVETITFSPKEDLIYFHNTHGQNLRVIELVAKGLPPEVPAKDSLATMKLCFAAEKSEDTGQIIDLMP